mmetsp:Transcript_24399/g.42976  ORF Transcript_24399/g.42976 Transcript_24399/m.42976 type:complete len:82 (-) Transcript_24399:110-355(-)
MKTAKEHGYRASAWCSGIKRFSMRRGAPEEAARLSAARRWTDFALAYGSQRQHIPDFLPMRTECHSVSFKQQDLLLRVLPY